MEAINASGREGYPNLELTARPERITAGGIVLLTLIAPDPGTYTVEWVVSGPVPTSKADTRIALLGATTVTGGLVRVTDDDNPILATLDTTPLSVGSWLVQAELTRVADEDEPADDAEPAEDGEPEVYVGE